MEGLSKAFFERRTSKVKPRLSADEVASPVYKLVGHLI